MEMPRKISTLAGVIVIIVFAVLAFGGVFAYQYFFVQTAPTEIVVNNTAKEVRSLESFIPTGWKVLGTENGDLNKDGLDDAVIVAENIDYKNEDRSSCSFSCPRKLLILFQLRNGGYELSAESDKAILLAGEGGVFGDPYESAKIENGSFLIGFYGGSAWRWSNSYRFRYQDGGWFLIGAATNNYWNGSDCVDKKDDYNFLTGKKQEIKSNKWDTYLDDLEEEGAKPCLRGEIWSDIINNKLVNLNDFTASGFDSSEF